ncbi:4Fe-4S dicluster domain-containing protein [Rubrivirga litoralis]|uniref:4Fe-4S dicluster domain-containing protein n=1 Tax=Rubrivirga litoralis TaxID=3075598 RepID=A0ABU3BPY8_9BACT|nr:4Fe-4S dicluster domain-containing protein [Rubrivirga sp. F394]MDT0631343.1 4Fe-4S dicluster domain-containing protein [Rubrivirga sp. F394]
MIELDVLSAADQAADRDAQAMQGRPAPWRSLSGKDGSQDPSVVRDEFLDPASDGHEGTSRRTFLQVMGASAALAGLSGCRRPVEAIVPYVRKPEEVIPGVPQYYATTMPLGGVGRPLVVQSHEGRPTKAEGNPEHPLVQGATDIFAQASVLQLYDPDRSRHVWTRGTGGVGARGTWDAFVGQANRLLAQRGTARLAVLAAPSASPTQDALRDQLLQTYPGARWVTLGPHLDDAQALGTQSALGQPARPLYRFADADVIVTFDADFLASEDPNTVWNNRQYAASRRVDERGTMSRMYAVESTMTMTGGMADHRQAVKAGTVPFVAAAVAEALGVPAGAQVLIEDELAPFVAAIASDVQAAGGRAAFVAGPTAPPELHALVAVLNGRFGGGVVEYLATGEGPVQPVGPELAGLVRDMGAGRVDALVMLGTNPVYHLPAELRFEEALAAVPFSVHTGFYRDESAQRATWHVPAAHYLESWGDARAYDGTLSVVQPLIAPLYDDAHSDLEVLNLLATGRNVAGYDLLRSSLRGRLGGDFETAWRTALHDGFVEGTGFPSLGSGGGAASLAGLDVPDPAAIELVVRLSPTLYDGQFSNVAWMQEAPHPVTKVTWDPVALVSPATALANGWTVEEDKGKAYATVIGIEAPNGAVATVPVWVQPGHPDNSITVPMGYGREIDSPRVIRDRGLIERLFNVQADIYYPGPVSSYVGGDLDGGAISTRIERLRPLGGAVVPSVGAAAVAEDYLLASTQDHGSMEGRHIVRMATLEEYEADPVFARDEDHFVEGAPWENFPPAWGAENSASEDPRIGDWLYSENQWGMVIDLNACTGCNACVVACQAENNVPVVGKEQVAIGREMHWLRLDRYYVGDETDPGMVQQPMMCVHCENAPCEQVCPVNATAHSPDGLNEMTYNRCIGTRYCANNCPYKVRRYNFYNWTKHLPTTVQMQSNPYVTVRYRGVMEKCTFCVQRIRQTQQYAHIENRPLRDGEVLTACQQVCPADAIVFGDLKDPGSLVNQQKLNKRNYAVLAELAVKPRLTYLARLRNPHPDLATPFDTAHGEHTDDGETHAAAGVAAPAA